MIIKGNTTPGHAGFKSASGRPAQRSVFGHLTIAGKTGDVARIDTADLFQGFDQMQNGIYVQAIGGNVQIDTTLVDVDIALNPVHDTSTWIADTTLTPGSITKLQFVGTAYRVTFTTSAMLYILGC